MMELYSKAVSQGSVEAKATLNCELGVAYGPGHCHKMDLFGFKSLPPDAPIFVFMHGGYWQFGSWEDTSYPAPVSVNNGIAFVALGYPIAPNVDIPTIVDSVQKGLSYICDIAQDSNRDVYVGGHSAGAHLAAITLIAQGHKNAVTDIDQRVKGVILVSGVFDLRPLVDSSINNALQMDSKEAELYSPLLHDIATHWCKPDHSVMVTYGQSESSWFTEQSTLYAKKLREAGVKVELMEVPNVDHFNIVEQLADPQFRLSQDIIRMIKHHQPKRA